MVKEAEQKLISIQNDIDTHGCDDVLLEHQIVAQLDLEAVLDKEEAFWREKANVSCHFDGDRNTKYFHRLSKIKNTSKRITFIKDGENMIIEPEQISRHITEHF